MQTELQNKWQQVMARDARQDGRFVFAVRTTGVYCRPSCPSRRPRRDRSNSSPIRTTPSAPAIAPACVASRREISSQAQYVARARQLLDNAEGVVTLAQLSKRVGLSPFHLQRLFKRATGLSPREYQSARRMQHVKRRAAQRRRRHHRAVRRRLRLAQPALRERPQQLGMTPGEYRRGGAGANITFAIVPTRWDGCWSRPPNVACARCVSAKTRLSWSAICARNSMPPNCIATTPPMGQYLDPLLAAIRGENTTIDLPLDVRATAFQMKVWETLRQIPRGETRSYSEIAREIGDPQRCSRRCARLRYQSGRDCGAMPSRRAQRRQSPGYRWGVERKKKLLEAEQQP